MRNRKQDAGCSDLQRVFERCVLSAPTTEMDLRTTGEPQLQVLDVQAAVVMKRPPLIYSSSFHFHLSSLFFLAVVVVGPYRRPRNRPRRLPQVTNTPGASQKQLKPMISSAAVSRLIYEFAFNTSTRTCESTTHSGPQISISARALASTRGFQLHVRSADRTQAPSSCQ